ncbi:MAG: right-handed parallel beta-helix repeat-containing protein, partial [Myxococcales bacterium]|nr:right-handed parallel beta-helix repeat-containing protein [Myxococcales bacterium]
MWTWMVVSALAATRDVGAGQPYATIGAALAASGNGDLILVHPGVYDERLVIDRRVEIRGTGGSGSTLLRSTGPGTTLIRVRSRATISGLTMLPGTKVGALILATASGTSFDDVVMANVVGTSGISVLGPVDVTITNSRFVDNDGTPAVWVQSAGNVTVTDTSFEGNHSTWPGAGLSAEAARTLVVERCTFVDNVSDGPAGALLAGGIGSTSVVVRDSVFDGNRAPRVGGDGGAAYLYATPSIEVSGSTFVGNSARADGGAVAIVDFAGNQSYRFHHDLFLGNDAASGGALSVDNACLGYYAIPSSDLLFGANTLVGNSADRGSAVRLVGCVDATVGNDLFVAHTGTPGPSLAVWESSAVATHPVFDHDLWWDNDGADTLGVATGANDLFVDPAFVSFSDDGDYANDDLALSLASPARDAGHPAVSDPDGSA